MKRKAIVEILISLFILLFIYTATSKLINFEDTVKSMHNQPLNERFSDFLIYAIPIIEIVVVVLLIVNRTKLLGLYLFTGVMCAFTGYVALVLANHYGRIPCSCGGLMKEMGWTSHLIMNVSFTLLGILAIYLHKQKTDFTRITKYQNAA